MSQIIRDNPHLLISDKSDWLERDWEKIQGFPPGTSFIWILKEKETGIYSFPETLKLMNPEECNFVLCQNMNYALLSLINDCQTHAPRPKTFVVSPSLNGEGTIAEVETDSAIAMFRDEVDCYSYRVREENS